MNNKQRGFTLVELMIAVAFVGTLLILIALVIVQIMGIYNKGLTLKSVNEISRTVVRDMQQSISSADYFKVYYQESSEDGDSSDSSDMRMASAFGEAEENGTTTDYYKNDAGGRLCTGVYSYAWNSGAAIDAWINNPTEHNYASYPIQFFDSERNQPVRFVKAKDPRKALCRDEDASMTSTYAWDLSRVGGLLPVNEESSMYSNVLAAGNGNLVLYQFDIRQVPEPDGTVTDSQFNTVSTFYSLSMVVGTQTGDESENGKLGFIDSNESCKPPGEETLNDGEYCAVNKIDFVARAGRIGE